MTDELYDFAATRLHETEHAVMLDTGNEDPVWFAKSLLEDNGDGTFTVPVWLARKKGIV